MTERPWWRRLDGQPINPRWWDRSPLARVGFIGVVIFGGGFLLRLAFADELGGSTWLWALLAAPFVVLLVVGVVRRRV